MQFELLCIYSDDEETLGDAFCFGGGVVVTSHTQKTRCC